MSSSFIQVVPKDKKDSLVFKAEHCCVICVFLVFFISFSIDGRQADYPVWLSSMGQGDVRLDETSPVKDSDAAAACEEHKSIPNKIQAAPHPLALIINSPGHFRFVILESNAYSYL